MKKVKSVVERFPLSLSHKRIYTPMTEQISKAKISLVASLAQRKMRRRHSLFVAEGAKCVADTLGYFRLRFAVATPSAIESGLADDIPSDFLFSASPEVMSKMSSLSTAPDVMAIYELPSDAEAPAPEKDRISLVLDGVQDPGNLGTIVRAAHWFGIKRIYCSPDTVDLFNPKTLMATMGSIGHLEIFYCDIISLLRDVSGKIPIYGTLLSGEDIYSAPLSSGGLIVMGNEGKGMSEEAKQYISSALTIPPGDPSDHAESLNVGVATAVVLSQFRAKYPL